MTAPTVPTLRPGRVQVWTLPLDAPLPERQALAATLAPGEAARAARFVFDRDRHRYEVCRGALRHLLGAQLGVAPDAFSLSEDPFGKPTLPAPHTGLRFNVSHSADLALIALARDIELGVDVEACRADIDFFGIAETHFSPAERRELAALPPELVAAGFYRAWSRKEAFIKATGLGLQLPLDSFDVTLAPDAPAHLVAVRDSRYRAEDWVLCHLDVDAPDFAAALVTRGAVAIDRLVWTHE